MWLLMLLPSACQAQPTSKIQLAEVFRQKAVVQADHLTEISGITGSNEPDSMWCLNDSGGKAELYRVDQKGQLKQTLKIKGVKPHDWEDLCRFEKNGRSYLLIADTGNNLLRRDKVWIYLVAEPKSTDGRQIETRVLAEVELKYDDGVHDCESIAWCDDWVYLATKAVPNQEDQDSSWFFRFQLPMQGKHKRTAQRIAKAPLPLATAMDISPDGMRLVIRDYLLIRVFTRDADEDWSQRLQSEANGRFPGPFQQQAEAVCFTPDGQELWTISEGRHPVWWQARLEQTEKQDSK